MIMNESERMVNGNLWKDILIFSLPLILSNLLQVLFNTSDIIVVGQFAGANSLGSVGSTVNLVTLFTSFLIGLSNGVNVLVGRNLGSKDHKSVKDIVHNSFIVCLITGIIIFLLGFFFSRNILILMQTKDELLDGAILYLKIYFVGMPALAIYNYGNAIYSAAGNTRKPLLYLSIAGVLNILLNLFFVIVCKLDAAGVAIASVISQYVSAILIVISLIKTKEPYHLSLKELKVSKERTKELLSLGLPSGLQAAIFAIANIFIQSAVNTLPTEIVDGNAAAQNADTFTWQIMDAFYVASSSFISQNLGAKKKKRIKETYFITTLYSFSISLIIGILLFFFAEPFLNIFVKEQDVVLAGLDRLKIMAFSYCISAFMDGTIASSRGLGKTVVPTIIVISGSCVLRIAWIYTIFAHFKTITSLYLLYSCSWFITAVAEIIYFIIAYKKVTKNLED